MSKKESLGKKIWKSRKQILEGIKNQVFKSDAVEDIAKERKKICKSCDEYDQEGISCAIPGTAPCCGDCGCSLSIKTRSLSSDCPQQHWTAVLTEEQDDAHDNLNPEQDD